MAKKIRPRTELRELDRARRKLVQDRERLDELSPGGSPDRPISVPTSALVESRALSEACVQCGGELLLGEHTAEVTQGERLRKVSMACRMCKAPRVRWFRIDVPMAN